MTKNLLLQMDPLWFHLIMLNRVYHIEQAKKKRHFKLPYSELFCFQMEKKKQLPLFKVIISL